MFYSMDFPSSLFFYSWTYPLSCRFSDAFTYLCDAGLVRYEEYWDEAEGFTSWELARSAMHPDELSCGLKGWAPDRPGGPMHGSELGIPAQFPGNLTYMSHSDY